MLEGDFLKRYKGQVLGLECKIGDALLPESLIVAAGAGCCSPLPVIKLSAWSWEKRVFVGPSTKRELALGELLGIDQNIATLAPVRLQCPKCGGTLGDPQLLLETTLQDALSAKSQMRHLIVATKLTGMEELDRASAAGFNRVIVGGELISIEDFPRPKNIGKDVLLVHRSFSVSERNDLVREFKEWCHDYQIGKEDLLVLGLRAKSSKPKYLLTFGKTRQCTECGAESEFIQQQSKLTYDDLSLQSILDILGPNSHKSGLQTQELVANLTELGAGHLKLGAQAADIAISDFFKVSLVMLDLFSPRGAIIYFDEIEAHLDPQVLSRAMSFVRSLAARGNICILYSKSRQILGLCDRGIALVKEGIVEVGLSTLSLGQRESPAQIVRSRSRSISGPERTRRADSHAVYTWDAFLKVKHKKVSELLGLDKALAEFFAKLPEARAQALSAKDLMGLSGEFPNMTLRYKGRTYSELLSTTIGDFYKHFENVSFFSQSMPELIKAGMSVVTLDCAVGQLPLAHAQAVRIAGAVSSVLNRSKKIQSVEVEAPTLGVPLDGEAIIYNICEALKMRQAQTSAGSLFFLAPSG